MWYQATGKRIFDFTLAFFLSVLLFPLFVVITALIFIVLGRPVFFTQIRPGLNNKLFCLYKFRTLKNCDGPKLPNRSDGERMTKFGAFLRTTSLDELPQLFNILRGDMSFVGPRPLLIEYLPLYSSEQLKRHDVRPGLTGLAQISGRNLLSWEEKFCFDLKYVEGVSFLKDLQILLTTSIVALQRKGIAADDSVTIEKFKGNSTDNW